MSDEPKADLALQRIQDHIDACSKNYGSMNSTFGEIRDSIKATNKLLISFISFAVFTVVAFAGYSYTQSQSLASQLAAARLQQAQAVQQIPDATVEKLNATLPPPARPSGN